MVFATKNMHGGPWKNKGWGSVKKKLEGGQRKHKNGEGGSAKFSILPHSGPQME